MLEVRDLDLVVAIVEEGGITHAGKRLHLSQSALSHQLREMEARLGARLFWRRNRRMLLTPAGERLLAGARPLLDRLRALEGEVAGTAKEPSELVRLSTECYTTYQWLPRVLRTFSRTHPDVEVRIVTEATRQPLPALLDGKLDVAVVSSVAPSRKLRVHRLFRDEVVVLVSAEHPLASRTFLTAEDFRGEHLLTYAIAPEEMELFTRILRPAGVSPARTSRVELTEAILEMVRAGLGISVLARWALPQELLRSGAVRAVPLTSRGVFRQWNAVTLASRRAPPALGSFVRTLAHELSALGAGPSATRSSTLNPKLLTR